MSELSFDLTLQRPDLLMVMNGAIPLDGVTAIMGPSGSGKTSLLMMLAGLEPRARGDIRFGEQVWSRRRRKLRPELRRIGVVFQEGRLFPHMTVFENISYGAERRGVAPTAVHGIANALGLEALLHRRPVSLSGGETRRVAVARALASDPDILFLDEPLSGLDGDAKAQVLPYLARVVSQSGVPVVYVTHSRSEVIQLADRVLEVRDGRIVGWGQPPIQLAVTLEEASAGRARVRLGRTSFTLPGQGNPGDARRIALPENGVLLSRDPPGPSGALAVLPGNVTGVREKPSGSELHLDVADQALVWRIDPRSELAERLPEPGHRLWLSILSAHLR